MFQHSNSLNKFTENLIVASGSIPVSAILPAKPKYNFWRVFV